MSLMKRLEQEQQPIKNVAFTNAKLQDVSVQDLELRGKVQNKLIQLADQEKFKKEEIRQNISKVLEEIVDEENMYITSREKEKIISQTIDEIKGYGPITPLVRDKGITEIMVNGPSDVYIEREYHT